jgi:hypothetical protein
MKGIIVDKPKALKTDGDRKWRRRQIFLRTGQAIMVVGGGVLVVHWLTHIEAFGPQQPPLFVDMVAGYPAGFLVFIVGAIVASRKPT